MLKKSRSGWFKIFWTVFGVLSVLMMGVSVGSALLQLQPDQPLPRNDANSQKAHLQLLDKAKKGGIDVYFEGDSIVRRWGATDYPQQLANWNQNFYGWNAADFGWGADRLENILWRLQNGELEGVHPKVIVLLGGTNNIAANQWVASNSPSEILLGFKKILETMESKAPEATIILTGIFPRNDHMELIPAINEVNAGLAKLADGKKVRYLNINDKLADKDGKLFDGMMNPTDHLHPALRGYQVWADALKPIFTELLGPPAKTDHAPPPTGDPAASH